MPNEPSQIRIQFTREFERKVRALSKKYRRIENDLAFFLEQLQAGETPGDQLSGTGVTSFKARIRNSDSKKGKSAGYRVYELQSATEIVLLTIYSKSEREDMPLDEIKRILAEFEQSNLDDRTDH